MLHARQERSGGVGGKLLGDRRVAAIDPVLLGQQFNRNEGVEHKGERTWLPAVGLRQRRSRPRFASELRKQVELGGGEEHA